MEIDFFIFPFVLIIKISLINFFMVSKIHSDFKTPIKPQTVDYVL